MNKLVTASVLLFAVSVVPATARPQASVKAIVLHLTQTAVHNVPRDRLRAALAVEATNVDPRKVQAEINRRMTAALAHIKTVPGISVETTGYNVYQARPADAPPRWHGSETIVLNAKDFTGLLALVGKLQQDGLIVRNLVPELSRAARQSAEDAATDAALARLRERARRIAAALGARVERYRDLKVEAAAPPLPLARAMTVIGAARGAPPPVAAPGEAAVSVTVDADILLLPKS